MRHIRRPERPSVRRWEPFVGIGSRFTARFKGKVQGEAAPAQGDYPGNAEVRADPTTVLSRDQTDVQLLRSLGSALDRTHLHQLGVGVATTLQVVDRDEDRGSLSRRVHPKTCHRLDATGARRVVAGLSDLQNRAG